jgi:predicted DNA-binding transcriptional regulator YafY
MPATKNAMARYLLIDRCLTNTMRKYPDSEFLLDKIRYELGIDISKSQLDKDIAAMKTEFRAPVVFDRAHRGYCYSEPGYSLRAFPLREDEVRALDQSIAVLRQIKGSGVFALYESAIHRIIQGQRISEITGGNDASYIQAEEAILTESNRWIEPLLEGIVERRLLSVEYQGFNREKKRHRFSPYLVKQYRNRWYVVGHTDRSDYTIVLALDRIVSVEKLRGAFFRDPSFDPQGYFRHAFGITHLRDALPQEIRLLFTPSQAPYIRTQPLHRSQRILSDGPDGMEVSLHVYPTRELTMTILGFGEEVEVLAPSSLADGIRKSAEAMASLYRLKK